MSRKRGRPRKKVRADQRYPNGRLIAAKQTVDPNDRTVELRAIMLGDCKADPSVTDHPMTLAFARGWIGEDDLRAGELFAADYRIVFGARPRTTAKIEEEPDRSERDFRKIGQMAGAEIAETFNAIMDKTPAPAASEDRRAKAVERYRLCGEAMTREQQTEVFLAFVQLAWPQWLTWRIIGRVQGIDSRRRWSDLLGGLRVIHAVQRRGMTRPAAHSPLSATSPI